MQGKNRRERPRSVKKQAVAERGILWTRNAVQIGNRGELLLINSNGLTLYGRKTIIMQVYISK